MCGIVGIIAKGKFGISKLHISAFEQLLFADQLRGTDGAGMFCDTNYGGWSAKEVGGAGNLFTSQLYEKVMDTAVKESRFLIGHNRAVTRGKKVWENTHPFVEKDIFLVHNGTLTHHNNLAEADVDSHAIAIHMAKNGYEKTLKEIDGAFALAWLDAKANTLNFTRNRERPLNLIECAGCWIVSSEAGLGEWIADRNDLIRKNTITLEPGDVYTFDLTQETLDKFEKTTVELKKPWVNSFQYTHTNKKKNKRDRKSNAGTNVLPFKPPFKLKSSYSVGDTIQFVPSGVVLRDVNLHYPYMIGHVLSSESGDKQVKLFGSEETLKAYDPDTIYEAEVVSLTYKNNQELYFIKNPNIASTEVDKQEEKKDEVEKCKVCGFNIASIADAVEDDAGNYTCHWCCSFGGHHQYTC